MVFYHNASPVLCTSISPSLLVTCLYGEAIHSLPSQVSFEVFHAALLQDTGVPWEGDKEHCQSVGNSQEVKGGISYQRTILNIFSLHLHELHVAVHTKSDTKPH